MCLISVLEWTGQIASLMMMCAFEFVFISLVSFLPSVVDWFHADRRGHVFVGQQRAIMKFAFSQAVEAPFGFTIRAAANSVVGLSFCRIGL